MKAKQERRIRICGLCGHHDRREVYCDLLHRAAPYNRVANDCEHWCESAQALAEAERRRTELAAQETAERDRWRERQGIRVKATPKEADKRMARELSQERVDKILEVYKDTGSVNRAAQIAGVSWGVARRYVALAQARGEQEDTPEPAALEVSTAEVEPEAAPQATGDDAVMGDPVADRADEQQRDVRALIIADLEEAQRAATLLETVRQVYGEAPEIEQAVWATYQRRRGQAA